MTDPALTPAIEAALQALRSGRPVLVTDAADREDEGDVILAGETLTAAWMAWTIRHTSGFICAPMPEDRAEALQLPLLMTDNADPFRTAYTVTVDARVGVTTGISAADRAHTIHTLAGSTCQPSDLTRPGHVVPLRAKAGGVLERAGHTEAAVDLCRLAGLQPVAAIGELVAEDGSMMRGPQVADLARDHHLEVLTIQQLVRWRTLHDRVLRMVETTLPTEHGLFTVRGYRDVLTGVEHVALVSPRGVQGAAPLVRLHSECLTGDVLGSQRCDCGSQLAAALARTAAEGGAVLYLRGHEGRGVGLVNKLRAYALQDDGLDTVDAQTALGLPVDDRDYTAAAAILTDLGLGVVRLLTNNPAKVEGLRRHGITVTAVEKLNVPTTAANAAYLRTKRDRMSHTLTLEAAPAPTTARTESPWKSQLGGAR